MNQLPKEVLDRINQTTRELKVVFQISDSDNATFIYANQEFTDFHARLGLEISLDNILNTDLEDYFRFYLGFNDEQIKPRMHGLIEVVKTGESYPFKEVSDHPGVLAMELDSIYHPVKVEKATYVIWESRLTLQTKS